MYQMHPKAPVAPKASDLQAQCLRRTLSQIELSGLRAALARRDRTRGWLA
jgi:hypothetical protein